VEAPGFALAWTAEAAVPTYAIFTQAVLLLRYRLTRKEDYSLDTTGGKMKDSRAMTGQKQKWGKVGE
jgi:hypothetical protein